MRFGCFGCLFLIVLALVLAVAALGVIFLSSNIFSTPELRAGESGRAEGYAAQQKLYEIVLRQTGQSSRHDPVAISEAEANGFLARHLDQSGLPLSPITVRFSRGQVMIQGRTALRNLFKGPPFAQLLPYVSDRRLDQPVWVTVRGRLRVEASGNGRAGVLDVDDFVLGKQPLGSFLPTLLLGPSGGGLLRWSLPSVVEDLQVGDGKLIIKTR